MNPFGIHRRLIHKTRAIIKQYLEEAGIEGDQVPVEHVENLMRLYGTEVLKVLESDKLPHIVMPPQGSTVTLPTGLTVGDPYAAGAAIARKQDQTKPKA